MPKSVFVSPHRLRAFVTCAVAFVAASAMILAQVPASGISVPSDPKALMLLAAKSNGLTGADLQPWHLKATYKLLDETNKTIEQGTYDESWANPSKYKRTITGEAFSQSTYGTDHGILQASTGYTPRILASYMPLHIVNPLPSEQAIQRTTFELQHREISGAKLTCLKLMGRPLDPGQNYCLSENSLVLLMSSIESGHIRAFHNRVVKFQGRFVAEDLQIASDSLTLVVHIGVMEKLPAMDDANFAPSADAVRLPDFDSNELTPASILHKVEPIYPSGAKMVGIQGSVVIEATISKTGRIENPHIIAGPSMLQKAALDAVNQWKYEPYKLKNTPVEMRTSIRVIFALGSSRR